MNQPFPFGLPLSTAFYLTLYIATLILHVMFMNYVLAGTILLAVGAVRGRLKRCDEFPTLKILRDWMPFALSGAITAGIAPVLFVQVLYQKEFYTANLLLFHRWMAILPVLIVAFYMIYLVKAGDPSRHPGLKRFAALTSAISMVFVAWSWTENHVLSLHPEKWAEQYATRAMHFSEPTIVPRLLVWVCGSFATLAVLLGWQLRYNTSGTNRVSNVSTGRSLGIIAVTGLLLAVAGAFWFEHEFKPHLPTILDSRFAQPYVFAMFGGIALQLIAWTFAIVTKSLGLLPLCCASAGLLMTQIGVGVAREAIRIAAVDPGATKNLDGISHVAGRGIFFLFAVISIIVVVAVFKTVIRTLRAS